MTPPQTAANLAAQHLVLVAQHEQLHVLGQVRANQHRQQAEQAPHQPVEQRQQHSEMVPATLLIPQQNPSSNHEIEFLGGTPHPRRPAKITKGSDQHRDWLSLRHTTSFHV